MTDYTCSTWYDPQSQESACFADFEHEREIAWLNAHPAAIQTGTDKLSQRLIDAMVVQLLKPE